MMLGRNTKSDAIIPHIPEDSVGVELGVWMGDTAQKFLDSGKVRFLILVDAWSVDAYDFTDEFVRKYGPMVGGAYSRADFDNYYDRLYEAVAKRFRGKPVAVCRCTTARFFARWPSESVDWVYIDASHEFRDVFVDLVDSLRIVRPGGFIFGDDYGNPSKPGVTQAVDEFLRVHWKGQMETVGTHQFKLCIPQA